MNGLANRRPGGPCFYWLNESQFWFECCLQSKITSESNRDPKNWIVRFLKIHKPSLLSLQCDSGLVSPPGTACNMYICLPWRQRHNDRHNKNKPACRGSRLHSSTHLSKPSGLVQPGKLHLSPAKCCRCAWSSSCLCPRERADVGCIYVFGKIYYERCEDMGKRNIYLLKQKTLDTIVRFKW